MRAYFRFIKTGRLLGVSHLHYLGVLAFIAICGLGVAFGFRIKVAKFWRIFLATDATILLIYLAWDTWAIFKGSWYFDAHQILGTHLLPRVPLEEVLFFFVVPFTTIMTYKALVKLTGWRATSE